MKLRVGVRRSIVRKLLVLFTIFMIFSIPSLASSDDWPMFLHDPQHTGNASSPAPNSNATLWIRPTIGGDGWSSPAVANGRVFVNKANLGILYSLYENNGTEIWNKTIGTLTQSCSTPAVDNGKVYIVGDKVYCFYENNGTEIWNKSVSGPGTGTSSPTVAEGRVFVNTQTLYCFFANNGTLNWSKLVGGMGYSTPAVADGRVFVHGEKSLDPTLFSFYTNNGTGIWNVTGVGGGYNDNSPVVTNGKVFYNPSWIKCLYANNGTEIWNQSNGGDDFSSPAVGNGKVFVNVWGDIYCYYENNGTPIWNVAIGGDYSTPAVAADGKVIVNGGANTYCLDDSNGAEIWSFATGGPGYSTPAIANGRVFVNQGTVYCFGDPPLTVDYIIIRDEPNDQGNIVTTATYSVWEDDEFYAAGYNNTEGYVKDVEVEWLCDNTSIGQVDSLGIWTNFTAQWVPSNETCTVNATYQGSIVNSTGLLTVLAPVVDYIQIRDTAGGGGNIVTTRTYSIQEVDEFYAAAYNNTASYLYDVEVVWESDNTSVGRVDSPGIWTNFTPLVVSKDSTCTVNATYGPGIFNSTGILTVRVVLTFILIRDNPRALGNEVDWISINGGETKTYYVAGYNGTTGVFMGIVVVNWSISNDIGTIDTTRGYSTNFTGSNVTGVNITGTFTVVYEGLPPLTIGVTVDLPPTAPTGLTVSQSAQGESLVIEWTANYEPDVMGYLIYRSETPGSNFSVVAHIIGAQNTYHLDTGLVDNTTYYYYIVAHDNRANYSPASGVVSGVSDRDTDLDGFYNLVDDDDDGDGLSDIKEAELGLNPLLADTDGDGYNDKKDDYPLDPDRWEKPGEFPWLLLLILIIIVIVVLILIFVFLKRWKKS